MREDLENLRERIIRKMPFQNTVPTDKHAPWIQIAATIELAHSVDLLRETVYALLVSDQPPEVEP
jgi:hypothetical protein